MSLRQVRYPRWFANIDTLELQRSMPVRIILSIVPMYWIKTLSIPPLDDLISDCPLASTMPNLSELSVTQKITSNALQLVSDYRFEQIFKLEITIDVYNV